jgi:hypothetical protein
MKPVVPVWMTDPVVTSMMISTLQQLMENLNEQLIARINEPDKTKNP